MSTTITCPSIVDIFSSGQTQHGNFKGVVNQLKWRQRFQRSDFYELELSTTEIITVKQILNGELKGLGTGMQVWPAAHVMVKYLEKNYRHSQGLVGKTVCDIGTGTGITGIAAANLGAKVTLTDQQHLLAFMQENVTVAEIAGIVPKGSLLVAQYDWGENAASLDLPFDFVLVSDCVLPKLYPIDILVEAVSAVMSEHTIAIFSYEHRTYPSYDPREEFRRLALLAGLAVKVIPMEEHDSTYCAADIELWEVTRLHEKEPTADRVFAQLDY